MCGHARRDEKKRCMPRSDTQELMALVCGWGCGCPPGKAKERDLGSEAGETNRAPALRQIIVCMRGSLQDLWATLHIGEKRHAGAPGAAKKRGVVRAGCGAVRRLRSKSGDSKGPFTV